MLYIALIEIVGNCRIYIQWLWIPLSGHPFGLPESSELLFENPQASPKGVNKKNEQGRANSSLIFSQEFLLFHISSPFWALQVLRGHVSLNQSQLSHLFQNPCYKRSDKTVSRLARCRFSQKRMNDYVSFCFFALHGKEKNPFIHFLGKSMAH